LEFLTLKNYLFIILQNQLLQNTDLYLNIEFSEKKYLRIQSCYLQVSELLLINLLSYSLKITAKGTSWVQSLG